jgi:hypothetical protein
MVERRDDGRSHDDAGHGSDAAFSAHRLSRGSAERWSRPGSGQTVGVRLRLVTAATLMAVLVSCSDGTERSTTAFCTRLVDSVALLEGPLSTPEDLAALLHRYRELERVAPLSIQAAWTKVTELVEAAASVDRDDSDAVAALAEQAFAADLAARQVASWVAERCGITMPRTPGS